MQNESKALIQFCPVAVTYLILFFGLKDIIKPFSYVAYTLPSPLSCLITTHVAKHPLQNSISPEGKEGKNNFETSY